MSGYVTLMGAEEVANAGHRMREAAREMQSAAGAIDDVFRRHQQFMEDWLIRFTEAMEGRKP